MTTVEWGPGDCTWSQEEGARSGHPQGTLVPGSAPPATRHQGRRLELGALHRRVQFAHLLEPNHVFPGAQPLASGDRAVGGLGRLWCLVSRAMSPCSPQDPPLLWVVARPLHCPMPVGPCAPWGEGGREVSASSIKAQS